MRKTLKNMSKDFKLLEGGIGGSGDGPTNTNVPNAADEQAVLDKLDKSVKYDEIDSVTFGLETDDGKIVKVYVNAEQADPFEKALAAKLGEIDDIEEVLNDLSKEFEIIDVDWPDEGKGKGEEDDDQDDGSEALDQRVYGPDHKGTTEDNFDAPYNSSELPESLSFGETATLNLLESASSLESRFTTPAQLMVYHAIIDLGIPEIALARNSYRAVIVKGIKTAAEEISQNAAMKTALKAFIRRAFDYEEKAKEHETTEKSEGAEKGQKSEKPVDVDDKKAGKPGVKESLNKFSLSEEKLTWDFKKSGEELEINSKQVNMSLDDENVEKLIKGLNNRDAVVVRDNTEHPAKKFIFSPRGSSVMVKAVGETDGFLMTSKDVENLIAAAVPDREVKEAVESPWDKLNKIAKQRYGEFGFATLDEDDMKKHIDLTAANKLAKKQGEFGFTTLDEDDMKKLINANPSLLKESVDLSANTKKILTVRIKHLLKTFGESDNWTVRLFTYAAGEVKKGETENEAIKSAFKKYIGINVKNADFHGSTE